MSKKTVRILLNVFGTLIALVFPTMINVINFVIPRTQLRGWLFVLLDLLILGFLIIFPLLTMRKVLHFNLIPLYASVVGFLLSARMTPILLPFFSENSSYGKNFGGAPLQLFFDEILFGTFACAALAAAILLTRKYKRLKKEGGPAPRSRELDFSVKE